MYDENLVTDNINLIYYILKKRNLYNKLEELYDIGIIGLVKAAKNYDENRGYAFSTVAGRYISNEILLYLRKNKTNKVRANNNTISLNTVIHEDKNGSYLTLEDTLASDIDIEDEIIKKEEIEHLYRALSKLDKKEYEIISYLYGLNRIKLTQYELSKKYNVSQAQISRIKKNCENKLYSLIKE